MGNLILLLLLVAVLFYIALIYTSEAMVLLAISSAVLFVLAAVYVLILRVLVLGKVLIPIAVADVGDSLTIQFKIRNRGFFSISRVKLLVEVENSFEHTRNRIWLKVSGLFPGENLTEYSLAFEQAGNYEIRLKKIRFYGLAGFLRATKRLQSQKSIRILPELFEVPVVLTSRVRQFFGDSDVYDEEKAGHDNSETFEIRAYRPGDKPQSIHWKLSAKKDELMVRENSLPKACPVVLLLDYRTGRGGKKTDFSVFLETAAALSFSLMDQKCPHYVAWYEEKTKDLTRLRVDDEESFYLFLTWYLTEQGKNPPRGLRRMYDQKYRYDQYIYCLTLTEMLVLMNNGQELIRLNQEEYRQQLGGLELVL